MDATTPYLIHLEGRDAALVIHRARGKERLGHGYKFDVEVEHPAAEDARSWLGRGARLELRVGHEVRIVGGIIVRAESGPWHEDRRRAKLRLAPRYSRLARRTTSRVFQGATSVDIALRVLREHGVEVENGVFRALPKRDICIQHGETDRDFVERVLAEDGVTFFFLQPEASRPEDPERVSLFDDAVRHRLICGDARLVYRPKTEAADQAIVMEERFVVAFDASHREVTKAAATRDFDLARPDHYAESRSPEAATAPHEEVFVHAGHYGETQPGLAAALVLEQATRDAELAMAETLSVRLAPGFAFVLDEHPDASFDRAWAVVEIRHEVDLQGARGHSYSNRIVCVRGDRIFRPKLRARRTHQSLQTAIVVGPPGEEIFTDALGRIKVQFHWDREGKGTDTSSCWIRVSQAWSGAAWGHQFIPRVGMEVLVMFLGGDLDRPICVGAVPNATHEPPFPLPVERTRSGIVTRSFGDKEGYNEISFEDAGGSEEVRVRAQRDFVLHALNDVSHTIDRDARTTVGANLAIEVGGAQAVHVAGPSVSRYGSAASASFEGELTAQVAGDLALHLAANRETHVEGADHSVVRGDRVDQIGGAFTVRAGSKHLLFVGDHDVEGHAEIQSSGAILVSADRNATIAAQESITFTCGESSIVLLPEKIILRSKDVVVEGSNSVTAKSKGPSLELTDKAQILADTLRILTKSASLELDEKAILRGKSITMANGEPKPAESDTRKDAETEKLKLKFTDERFRPYAKKRYEIRAAGTTAEGTTGEDGKVEAALPKGAKVASVILWIDEYPTGRRKEMSLALDDLPAIDTIPGLRLRLKNLGYYAGSIDGDRIDATTADALRSFQRDHCLTPSGRPDPRTEAAIVDRYGH